MVCAIWVCGGSFKFTFDISRYQFIMLFLLCEEIFIIVLWSNGFHFRFSSYFKIWLDNHSWFVDFFKHWFLSSTLGSWSWWNDPKDEVITLRGEHYIKKEKSYLKLLIVMVILPSPTLCSSTNMIFSGG